MPRRMTVPGLALLAAAALPLRAEEAAEGPDPFDQSGVPIEVEPTDPGAVKIVLVAGTPSHGPGDHEHFAGCALLMNLLKQTPGVFPVMARDGWPKNETIFEGARAIVFYCDGGGGHPILPPARLKLIGDLMKKGVGLGCIHYAVEVQKDGGGPQFLDWIGGYFETFWSVNPHWTADFKILPDHPVARGVKPFAIGDEWYHHMRFREDGKGTLSPILSAVPPKSTVGARDDAHGGNPGARAAVERGEAQHVVWAYERPAAADAPEKPGRGFGFTGGHFHKNWGDENFRRVAVNAILWIAHVEVPPGGAPVALDPADLRKNLDRKGQARRPKPVPKDFRAAGKPQDVRAWAFIGPFPNDNDAGFDAVYPPEKALDVKASFPGKGGKDVAWRAIQTDKEGLADTEKLMGESHTNSTSYFSAVIASPNAQNVNFGVGSDDSVKVWLNGELIHQNHCARSVSRDDDTAWGKLKAGENTLLVKLTNGGGAGGLLVTVKAEGITLGTPVKQE